MCEIQIKTLHTLSDFQEFSELQKKIWKFSDGTECVPDYILMAADEYGGIVFGAYDGSNMIGIELILPAYTPEDGFFHYDQLLGIHPDWQHKGLGYKFKTKHYEEAKKMGVKKVTWTYDPLQGPNANLNVQKSGGIVREYRPNIYGEYMGGSELNSGIPSERFILEWYVSSKRVQN